MTKISIVIPVFNSEQTIESLCKTLISLYRSRYTLEIILVNDNSTDSSHVVCMRLHQENRDIVTYVRLARNFGEHSAVMAGLNHVTGDYCVIMDDDFQNPPEEVSLLVDKITEGYDVVYSRYAVKRDGFFRNLGSRVHDKMANVILRKPADLYLSSFKAINRFLVQEIIKYTGPDPYLDAIILRTTTNIGSVEARHDRRQNGRSGYTFRKLISLWGSMVVSFSLVPLRIIGVVGLALTIIGIAVVARDVIAYLIPELANPTEVRWLTSSMCFYRGIELAAVSVVGEYTGRIYLLLTADPQFVIRERITARGAAPCLATVVGRKGHNAVGQQPA